MLILSSGPAGFAATDLLLPQVRALSFAALLLPSSDLLLLGLSLPFRCPSTVLPLLPFLSLPLTAISLLLQSPAAAPSATAAALAGFGERAVSVRGKRALSLKHDGPIHLGSCLNGLTSRIMAAITSDVLVQSGDGPGDGRVLERRRRAA